MTLPAFDVARRPDGSIDTDAYRRCAADARRAAIRDVAAVLSRAIRRVRTPRPDVTRDAFPSTAAADLAR